MNKFITQLAGVALIAGATLPSYSQATPDERFVSKEEYQKLLREHEAVKKELEEMRAFRAQFQQYLQHTNVAAQVATPAPAATTAETGAPDKNSRDPIALSSYIFPGSTKFMLTGYGAAGFEARQHNDAVFSAQFNPIFLWKISDRLFFEGELELELEGSETSTKLEVANLNYILNDYVTFGAGKFLNPMNSFVERYHMAWVNRLPDKPLAVYDGLLPETYVGAEFRGGVPVGSTKFNYALFVANAPNLIKGGEDLSQIGALDWDNFGNNGGSVTLGGHVGFLPIPELELGYGLHHSGLGGSGADALVQSADLNYVKSIQAIRGMLRVNAQWVWSHVDHVTYDATEAGGPAALSFSNRRDGGYAQVAYRPTLVSSRILQKLEGVFRWDMLNQPAATVGYNQTRYTFGLNYWITPKTVFKVAYQLDDKDHHAEDESGVLVQFATGF